MATTPPRTYDLEQATPRRLAEVDGGPVLSLFVDLEPSEFATPPARRSQVRSLVDDAARQLRAADLPHDIEASLRSDLEEIEQFLERDMPANGARGVAVYRSSRAGLFDAVRLARRVSPRAVLDDSPYVEPLVEAAPGADWCVLLVNRKLGRVFRGTAGSLHEVARVSSDTHGQHDQGGWSQRNYEASVENEAAQHVRRTAAALFRRYRLRPFDHLLVGAPPELVSEVEDELHPYLRERLAGRVEIDVENTTAADVRKAAAPRIEEREILREREALDRLQAGVASPDGHGVSGLGDVLAMLDQHRVETLLLAENFSAPGVCCPACGWLGPGGVERCPADETAVESHDEIVERMVERALAQSAEVLVVTRHPDLGPIGHVGAILRF